MQPGRAAAVAIATTLGCLCAPSGVARRDCTTLRGPRPRASPTAPRKRPRRGIRCIRLALDRPRRLGGVRSCEVAARTDPGSGRRSARRLYRGNRASRWPRSGHRHTKPTNAATVSIDPDLLRCAGGGGSHEIGRTTPCKAKSPGSRGSESEETDAVGCWIGYLASSMSALIPRIRLEN
jgi:hypothetical protein